MIRVEKALQAPALDVFTRASIGPKDQKITRARAELERAIAFFTNPLNFSNEEKLCLTSFNFSVYKDKKLAEVLASIFGCKCAYCESRIVHVMPREIEHFRPKSSVENSAQNALRPGYYWLAGDWNNLLVACVDCNRARNHTVPGQSAEVRLGKHAQFPLSMEMQRVRLHTGNVAAEEPYRLLIHPCVDNPEEKFTYTDDGLIHPKVPHDLQATTSITAYALQRKYLVEERKRVLNDLKLKLELLKSLGAEFNAMHGDAPLTDLDGKRNQINLQMSSILHMFTPDAPFLGMVRDYIRRHVQAGIYNDLLGVGLDLRRLVP
ncbi:hypothetical protein GIW26_18430 [Pseudomonas syringae]|uniref:hypothetical protein n=1 Tax=Pseudomonas syringae TaxID=317 RepID=UPI001F42D6D6|nr:hypothetical protein [Pseudomonas syringae]MCF8985540.1 hypothetical protein [Pseudomonas syringae]